VLPSFTGFYLVLPGFTEPIISFFLVTIRPIGGRGYEIGSQSMDSPRVAFPPFSSFFFFFFFFFFRSNKKMGKNRKETANQKKEKEKKRMRKANKVNTFFLL